MLKTLRLCMVLRVRQVEKSAHSFEKHQCFLCFSLKRIEISSQKVRKKMVFARHRQQSASWHSFFGPWIAFWSILGSRPGPKNFIFGIPVRFSFSTSFVTSPRRVRIAPRRPRGRPRGPPGILQGPSRRSPGASQGSKMSSILIYLTHFRCNDQT